MSWKESHRSDHVKVFTSARKSKRATQVQSALLARAALFLSFLVAMAGPHAIGLSLTKGGAIAGLELSF